MQNDNIAIENSKIKHSHIIVIGGGSAGLGLISSLLKRDPSLDVTLIEPKEEHYYQPAWTLVGAGIYDLNKTKKPLNTLLPKSVTWIKEKVTQIIPQDKILTTSDGHQLSYQLLVICPGLELRWDKIAGLSESLGKNGVTSNYHPDYSPYTWELIKSLRSGNAIFTQPPVPIKCAGAPQKALYLACDHWKKANTLNNIHAEINLAGQTLFSASAFIPSLLKYMQHYNATPIYNSNLVKVDGENKKAYFETTSPAGEISIVVKDYDLLHVVPPQSPPVFIAESGLANETGWCHVDAQTLQHVSYDNIFSLGDVISTSNSKTGAAARKQIIIVAKNIISYLQGAPLEAKYDGYSSCPLTVERGKVILAEFGYEGKLLPTFPLNPLKANRFAWFLTARFLPVFYWSGMLKGIEWLTGCSKSTK